MRYLKKIETIGSDEIKNKLIIGDNYDALHNLIATGYSNKISVIYIDPPYGMDNERKFAATNYENRIDRDALLSMLQPRLILAKDLLSEEGIIFCSIDDRNQAHVKLLFDTIFGESNFICNFIWEKNYSPKNKNKFISANHDYILCYAKNKWMLNGLNKLERTLKNNKVYTEDDGDGRGLYQRDNLTIKGQKGYSIVDPKTGIEYKEPQPNGWRYNEKKWTS